MTEKMYLLDHQLSETGGTRYSENMNIVVFLHKLSTYFNQKNNFKQTGIRNLGRMA